MLVLFCCPTTSLFVSCFFFFNESATTEIYTLSLHDALPIWSNCRCRSAVVYLMRGSSRTVNGSTRSEEHTSELQSLTNLVCRLLLEKKKKKRSQPTSE